MHSKTDSTYSSAEALRYPFENHPGHDQVVEVVPGVLWVRLKLPFRLNHVNIYLFRQQPPRRMGPGSSPGRRRRFLAGSASLTPSLFT